jgi:hypothetical protein
MTHYMIICSFIYIFHICFSLIGLLRQPKWGHLKDLHHAVKQCELALVAAADPVVTSLGHNLQVPTLISHYISFFYDDSNVFFPCWYWLKYDCFIFYTVICV